MLHLLSSFNLGAEGAVKITVLVQYDYDCHSEISFHPNSDVSVQVLNYQSDKSHLNFLFKHLDFTNIYTHAVFNLYLTTFFMWYQWKIKRQTSVRDGKKKLWNAHKIQG